MSVEASAASTVAEIDADLGCGQRLGLGAGEIARRRGVEARHLLGGERRHVQGLEIGLVDRVELAWW